MGSSHFGRQWFLLIAALLALGCTVGWLLYAEYHTMEVQERQRLIAQTKVVEENLEHQLTATHHALNSIRSDLPKLQEQKDGPAQLNHRLQFMRDAMPTTRAITVFDAEGTLIARSPDKFVGQNFGHRDYFQIAQQGGNPATLYVAPPFLAATGERVLNVSKVLRDERGAFNGVILVSLGPEYFKTLMKSLLYAPDMHVTLLHGDGTVIFSTSDVPQAQGTTAAPSAALLSVSRTIRPASVPMDTALVVTIGREDAAFFAPWREDAFLFGGFFLLLTIAAVVGLSSYQARQVLAQAAVATERASMQRFHAYFDHSIVGLAITGLDKRWIEVNDALCTMLGYRRDELTRMTWAEQTHPEDLACDVAQFRRMLAGEIESYFLDKRFIHKEGHIVYTRLAVSHVRKSNGSLDYVVATLVDISERKLAEAELRIAAAAFESQEGMLVTDAHSVILRVNRAFTTTTGYSAEELVGQTPRVFRSGRHDTEFYRAMWETIRHTGGWQGEIWDRRKNGEEFLKWLTISVVKDEKGAVTHYIGIHYDITERKKAEEKIRELAFFDTLTGLSNRLSLKERLRQALSLAQRNGKQLAVMLIDLDNFKTINDTLGHSVGDHLLVEVAQRLLGAVRPSDLVARLGGDEFVIVLPDIDSPTDPANIADKILMEISAAYSIEGHELQTSPSIGICLYPDDAMQAEDLLKKADVAMYHAKSKGKNNYQFFRDEIQAAAVHRMALEADLRTALKQQQFVLHYQPQLDLRTGHLSGVEALVRWQHPERGLVPPNAFIPLAEETGLILPLGSWVLEEACRTLTAWRERGIHHIKMSVNLAASQFADHSLPLKIEEILAQYDLPPDCLDLEVTESMAMQSPDATSAMMRVLTEKRLTLSIDDFGTGYSSLAYLKTFPISTLKIDRSFVKDIETDQNDADICGVTVLLAHKLGLDVVAEGVETQAQRQYLHSIGCEKIQGYLISKPLPADQAEAFIRQNAINSIATNACCVRV